MYSDIIEPKKPEDLSLMKRKALSLGYDLLGVIGELPAESGSEDIFKVSIIKATDLTLGIRHIRRSFDVIAVKPYSLEEARKAAASKVVDAIIATYDRARPNFDYICAKQLKRNEGSLIIPARRLMEYMRTNPQVIRSVKIELEIAIKAGVYPIIASFASNLNEIVPPRLLTSFGEFFFDLDRNQAKMYVKDFPKYLVSQERKLKLRGVV